MLRRTVAPCTVRLTTRSGTTTRSESNTSVTVRRVSNAIPDARPEPPPGAVHHTPEIQRRQRGAARWRVGVAHVVGRRQQVFTHEARAVAPGPERAEVGDERRQLRAI